MTRPASPTVRTVTPANVNKNTNWVDSPGFWLYYCGLIVLSWLVTATFTDPGIAWTYVHLAHGLVSYYLLHWQKGSPIEADQGKYDYQTFWEQLNDGVQYTHTRKFFTLVPVITFILATHGTDYRRQPLGLNLIVVIILVVAKAPAMHKVRILGINKY